MNLAASANLFSISFWAFVGLILIFRITRLDGVSPLSVPSAAKDLNNAKEVVGQLWGHFCGVEDCDSDVVDGKDVFKAKRQRQSLAATTTS